MAEHRIIGRVEGETPGTLVIAMSAIHGNEPAGVLALHAAFKMLNKEPKSNFKGRFVGMIGNLQAFKTRARFLEQDFNRIWSVERVRRLFPKKENELKAEDKELLQLYRAIRAEIENYKPRQFILLDLHTTSAGGGIFSIPTDEKGSLKLAKALLAPVILNLFDRVEGTLLRFATDGHFDDEPVPAELLGIAYEAGQHNDPLSVSRSLSAILNTLHFAGCISDHHLRNPQEMILQKSFAELPKVTRLTHVHHIKQGEAFVMRPGYVNFQKIHAGEHLADDVKGPIFSPFDGLILMPLYQPQGSDGFFIVQEEQGH